MPQDKRLIITKAVLYKVQKVCASTANKINPSHEAIYVTFLLPPVILAQTPELLNGSHWFALPHSVYCNDGRSVCLIVPKLISTDCFKINKRHGYFDAVVTAEGICKKNDTEAVQRAYRVANTFRVFMVDSRIVNKLPVSIYEICKASEAERERRVKLIIASSNDVSESVIKHPNGSFSANVNKQQHSKKNNKSIRSMTGVNMLQGNGQEQQEEFGVKEKLTETMLLHNFPVRVIVPIDKLDDRTQLHYTLSQATSGGVLHSVQNGQLYFCVGNASMTAGDICANAKQFIHELKKDFPSVFRFIHEFKLCTNVTESIRFMEVNISH